MVENSWIKKSKVNIFNKVISTSASDWSGVLFRQKFLYQEFLAKHAASVVQYGVPEGSFLSADSCLLFHLQTE
jgi:predicted acetyltransferase